MGQYKLSARFIMRARQRVLRSVAPVAVGIVAFGIFIAQADGNFVAIVIGLLAAVLGMAVGIHVQLHRRFQSYLLTIQPQCICRQQRGVPDMIIGAADITKIVERAGCGMLIHGPGKQMIAVPDTLEGYAEVRAEVAALHAIETVPASQWPRSAVKLLFLMAIVGALVGLHVSHNPCFITIAGIALAIALIVAMVMLQRSPHVEQKVKRLSWFCLLPLLDIVHRVVTAIRALW